MRDRIETKGFLPLRPTQKRILDARVRKPPGADAGGGVVSAEPPKKATTIRFLAAMWSQNGDRAVASGPRVPSYGARATTSGFVSLVRNNEPSQMKEKLPG